MLETSTIDPCVSRRSISSAAARASSTGASKFAVKEAWRGGPARSPPLSRAAARERRRGPRGRDDTVELALPRERVLDVAFAPPGQRDVAPDEMDEPAV